MDSIKRIGVGSTNPVKIAAVRTVVTRAFPAAEVIGLSVDSGVSEQPWGDEEARLGARNRARAVLAAAGSDLGVGLEGGVLETELERVSDGYIYEIELVDDSGQVWELKLDASSGELLQSELED